MRKLLSLLIVGLTVLNTVPAHAWTPGNIITVAGGGPSHGGDALQYAVDEPLGVAADSQGNIYFSTNNEMVYRRSSNGTITVVAGNGSTGFSGDGGPATQAMLNNPGALAIDKDGNLYISDTANFRIRKVSPAGIIITVAGTGFNGYDGDEKLATSAAIGFVKAMAVDKFGNLYLADQTQDRIREIRLDGMIHTIAGNGTAGYSGDGGPAIVAMLNGPVGVAIDKDQNVYISDSNNHIIRCVNPEGDIITIAGMMQTPGSSGNNGPATLAKFSHPGPLAFDAMGDLYVADQNNYRIRKITMGDGIVREFAGNGDEGFSGDNGLAGAAQISYVTGLAVDNEGGLVLADTTNNRIRRVKNGVIETVGGNGTDGYFGENVSGTLAQLYRPSDVAFDSANNLYIADDYNGRIRKLKPDGTITTVAGKGGIANSGDGGPATSASFSPSGVVIDPAGNIYIADDWNCRIRKVTTDGKIQTFAGNGVCGYLGDGGLAINARIRNPSGMALDSEGNLFFADDAHNCVRRVGTDGIITTVAGRATSGFSGDGGSATDAQLNSPFDVFIDGSGRLLIADLGNHRIRRVTNGIIETVAGNGVQGFGGDGGSALNASFNNPASVMVDGEGNIFVSDRLNHRIRMITPAGIVSTVVGTGDAGFSGDSGPATNAKLNTPYGIAMNSAGALFIADRLSDRVRKVGGNIVNIPPTISITSPADGSEVTGYATMDITVNVSDADGNIVKVEFFEGPTKLGESLSAPFGFQWLGVPLGSHTLTAKATDDQGDSTMSAPVTFMNHAIPNTPPTIKIDTPVEGSKIFSHAAYTIFVTAADSDGTITKVEFYNSVTKIGESTVAPFFFSWEGITYGHHTISAKAFDNSGDSTISTPVNFSHYPAPSVTITSPAGGANFLVHDNITITAAVDDPHATTKEVKFLYRTEGNNPSEFELGSDTQEPFTTTWNDVPLGTYFIVARLSDDLGFGTENYVAVHIKAANQKPTIQIDSPANGGIVWDGIAGLHMTASDPDGTVSKVEIFEGANKLGETAVEPYTFNIENLSVGEHTITVRAVDDQGEFSDPKWITVTAHPVPKVKITSPADGTKLIAPASITINATVDDPSGFVKQVKFYYRDISQVALTEIGTDTQAPYSIVWNNPAVDDYELIAEIHDADLGFGVVDRIVVLVLPELVANLPPVIHSWSVDSMSPAYAPADILFRADASDPDGTIAKVEFFNGNKKIGEDSTQPYEFNWTGAPAGSYLLRIVVTDNEESIAASDAVAFDVLTPPVAPPPPPPPSPAPVQAPPANAINVARPNLGEEIVLIGDWGSGHVRARVFDRNSRLIRTVMDEDQPNSEVQIRWNCRNDDNELVAPSVYFVLIEAGGKTEKQSVVVRR